MNSTPGDPSLPVNPAVTLPSRPPAFEPSNPAPIQDLASLAAEHSVANEILANKMFEDERRKGFEEGMQRGIEIGQHMAEAERFAQGDAFTPEKLAAGFQSIEDGINELWAHVERPWWRRLFRRS